MTRRHSSIALGFVLMVLASPVSAGKATPRDVQEKAAKKACAVGDFQRGVDILADLLVETNDITYVFNQGRCYQQNNRFAQAISRFREYLRRAKGLSDGDTADVERQIADCEASQGKLAQLASPPPPASGPPTQVSGSSPAQVSEPAAPQVSTQQPPTPFDDSAGRGLRTTGIVSAAVGLAAVVVGVGLALKTQSISSDEQKNGATPAKEDQRKSLETWGWVSYGLGAAAIATGTTLYVLGWSRGQSTKVAFMPILAPDTAAVILKGSF
jgi:hypothetical protein